METIATARSGSAVAAIRETAGPATGAEPVRRTAAIGGLQATGGGTFSRLLRFAVAGVRRRPERFILSVLGIGLAMTAVIVVRTISVSYSSAGTTALTQVLDGAPLWVVPAQGTTYDPQLRALLPDGPAPALRVPTGWSGTEAVGGIWQSPRGRLALFGRSDVATGTAEVGTQGARELGVSTGSVLSVGGRQLRVAVVAGGRTVTVARGIAEPIVGRNGWWTVRPSAADAGRTDIGSLLAASSGLRASTDPTAVPTGGRALIYDTRGASGSALTFAQRWSGAFAGKVTGSTLGIVSIVGLLLGFVIAVSSFLAAVTERRREFGIMSSIGLADEILYFFLVESALVYVVAYVGGALLAGAAVALVVPGLASVGAWAQAAGLVAGYLPVMAIVGALIPVHRLLQQRPVALLADA